MHDRVARKHWIEGGGLTRVGAHRFDTHTEDVALARQKRHAFRVKSRCVRAVGCDVEVKVNIGLARLINSVTPETHAPLGYLSMLPFPPFYHVGRQQEIGVLPGLLRHVDHARWADEALHRTARCRIWRVVFFTS